MSINTRLFIVTLAGFVRMVCLTAILVLPGYAAAQTIPAYETGPFEVPENLTQADVRDLVARLSDDQVRELIIRELDKQAVAEDVDSEASAYFEQLNLGIHAALDALARMFDTREQLHDLPAMIGQQISDNGRISSAYLWFQFLGLMVAGFAAERLARRLLEKSGSKPGGTLPLGRRFDLACYGVGLGLVELGAFAVGAFIFIEISGHDTENANQLWYEITWCLVYIKLVLLAVRQIAAPWNPDTRLAPISNAAATQALGWTLVLASVLILPQPILRVGATFGATEETLLLIRLLAGLLFIGLLIVLIVRLRDYVRQLITGDEDSGFIRREAFMRIQRAFEKEGIQFAPRRVLVEAETPQEAVKAAAGVLDQEVEGATGPKTNQSNQ